MKTIGEKIKSRRKELKMSVDYVAEKIGKNRATVYRYESDEIEDVSISVLGEIAKLLRIDPVYLMGLNDSPDNSALVTDYNYYPTAISAGLPFEVDGITESEKVAVPDMLMGRWAGQDDVFLANINGDSMNNLIKDGSLIAIKPIELNGLKNGDVVVFSDNHEYSVKHFHQGGDKLIFKSNSSNPNYYDQTFSESDNIKIHGKVIMWTVTQD